MSCEHKWQFGSGELCRCSKCSETAGVRRLLVQMQDRIDSLQRDLSAAQELLGKERGRYNALHYAVRRDANILDHKLTEDEAHARAMAIVEELHAFREALYRIASPKEEKT